MSDMSQSQLTGKMLIDAQASGEILVCGEGVSFWGGVDPETGQIIDIHHSCYQQSVGGKILMMPSSRGSCSGSGVLLALALNGQAPAAIIFSEPEEILSLGALVATHIFNRPMPVIWLDKAAYELLATAQSARIDNRHIRAEPSHISPLHIRLELCRPDDVILDEHDKALLAGENGSAAKIAMEILCLMAAASGADRLVGISRGHIDGSILAHSANLVFAETLAGLGARVAVPTTINAISVDRENWPAQSVPADFGEQASRLADAYVTMGAAPVFTCAPYLLDSPPAFGEMIGWSESNAVIFANSVLGARTVKHPDYLDLFIAMTGKAPASGVYSDAGRQPQCVISVCLPDRNIDDLFWPLLGWLAGKISARQIPLITGLEHLSPTADDLKALCAAFGTTSGAAMLHIAGHTPEADMDLSDDATRHEIDISHLKQTWADLNQNNLAVDLVAIGSPHASYAEILRLCAYFGDRRCHHQMTMIVTTGRDTLKQLTQEGLYDRLAGKGVKILPDICWCSITEPVLPVDSSSILTNSGKYAHYAYALSGRHARLASLKDCVETAITGRLPELMPEWMDQAG